MITTEFVPGSPCWTDLGTPDVPAAAAFYGAVLGWRFESAGPASGGYGFFRYEGGTVAAVGPLTEPEARPAWTPYFTTADADATARAATAGGGAVRVAPVEVMGQGRMAQLTDPLGARFAVWEPAALPGLDRVDAPGALCWVELCTTDVEVAGRFYGALFRWDTHETALPGGGGTYTLLAPAGGGAERQFGGMVAVRQESLGSGGAPYWHPVFAVADCDAAVARVGAADGRTVTGPEDAPGVGRLAVCHDPAGAEFVLLTPEEMR
jgi:predicted enzyme related to lactoylglutathione lyase